MTKMRTLATFSYLLFLSLMLSSCSKSDVNSPATDGPGVVQTWRYPCGSACNAIAWVLVMQDGNIYEAPDLPPTFKKEEQPVLVQYRKTGKKSTNNPGTGLELISILQIRPR